MEQQKENASQKLLHRTIYAALACTMGFVALISYWMFYPYNPISAQEQPFEIVDEDGVLQAGDPLIYRSNVCKDFEGELELDRVLVNDILIRFTPQKITEVSHECKEYDNYTLSLPDHTPNGIFHLEITATVRVNPIRTVSVKFVSEEFEVRNPVLELNERVEKLEDCFGLLCPVSR